MTATTDARLRWPRARLCVDKAMSPGQLLPRQHAVLQPPFSREHRVGFTTGGDKRRKVGWVGHAALTGPSSCAVLAGFSSTKSGNSVLSCRYDGMAPSADD